MRLTVDGVSTVGPTTAYGAPTATGSGEPGDVAAKDMTAVVALVTEAIVVPGGMLIPVRARPTSPGPNAAEADVSVFEPVEVMPSIRARTGRPTVKGRDPEPVEP